MNIEERHFLRPKEFSQLFNFSVKHCYALLARGELPAVRRRGIGWLIDKRRFEKELEAGIEIRG